VTAHERISIGTQVQRIFSVVRFAERLGRAQYGFVFQEKNICDNGDHSQLAIFIELGMIKSIVTEKDIKYRLLLCWLIF